MRGFRWLFVIASLAVGTLSAMNLIPNGDMSQWAAGSERPDGYIYRPDQAAANQAHARGSELFQGSMNTLQLKYVAQSNANTRTIVTPFTLNDLEPGNYKLSFYVKGQGWLRSVNLLHEDVPASLYHTGASSNASDILKMSFPLGTARTEPLVFDEWIQIEKKFQLEVKGKYHVSFNHNILLADNKRPFLIANIELIPIIVGDDPSYEGTNYYIDDFNGNDYNSGKSPQTAWKTLSKVNSTTFSPGDSILFKSGGVWIGQLYPKGSGRDGKPIVIDQYGGQAKPWIDGDGIIGTGAVYLYNQSYWEINNLEITNDAEEEADRRGVRIEINSGAGVVNHIYLRNLHVHHVKGRVGQDRSHKRTSGIGFGILDTKGVETRFNDILVEGCLIHDCSNQGIVSECVKGDGYQPGSPEWNLMRITNARIRNNTIYNISKNAMIIRLFDKGVVEYNVCYNTANGITGNTMFTCACDSTIFQFNEGYLNNSPEFDGCMYDADLRSPNTIWQYSYSHDNAHGLFWTCTVQEDANVICRYNISQNDKGMIFCLNYPVTSMHIYNNTIYIPSHLSPTIIAERGNGDKANQPNTRNYTFKNNIIYNESNSATYLWNYQKNYTRFFEANCFYGKHPVTEPIDAKKITADPMLVNPGSGGIGIYTVDGYKLQENSPCIDAGVEILGNGGRDYWGNLLNDGKTDIGAHEFTLTSSRKEYLASQWTFRLQTNVIRCGEELVLLSDDTSEKSVLISIYTEDGKQVFSQTMNLNTSVTIDKSFSYAGLYFLQISAADKVYTEKIVVL